VTSKVTGAGKVPIRRAEMSTHELDEIADLINRQYVEHKAWFRRPAPSRVDAGLRLAATGSLEAAVGRYRGFDYHAQASGPEDHLALVVLNGEGTFTRGREQLRFARGDVVLLASGERFMTDMYDFAYALVRISPQTLTALAEEYAGLPPGSMRIESMAPVSRAARERWSQTSTFICRQLLGSPGAGISPIVAKEMARLAAATVLDVFPSTAMTAAHTPGPSCVPPATAPTPPPVRQSQPSPAAGAGPAQRALLPPITGSTGKRLASHCAADELTYDADDVASGCSPVDRRRAGRRHGEDGEDCLWPRWP
jgi:hypothetical protein